MASPKTSITITHADSVVYQSILDRLFKQPSKPREQLLALRNFFHASAGIDRNCKLQVQVNSGEEVFAHATVTVSSGAAGDTAVVSGTTFTAVDHRETTNITFGADSSGSLNSKYFTFQDQSGAHRYYVWFNINSAGVDPKPGGYAPANGIKVSGATSATAATLATAAIAAINAAAIGVTASAGTSGHAILTDNVAGTATAVADGASTSTGFTFTRSVTGSAVSSVQYNLGFSDTATAANIAAQINAHSALKNVATATSAAAVVTVSSFYPGPIGNYITLTATTGNTASAATLASGALSTTVSAVNAYSLGV